MAIATRILAAAIVLLAVSSGGVDARPCRTIFIAYSSDEPVVSVTQIREAYLSESAVFLTVRRVFRATYLVGGDVLPSAVSRPAAEIRRSGAAEADPRTPLRLGFQEGFRSSLEERARDILVVVAGLLFGVGCGALTAATMYLVWSVVASRRQICGGADDSDEEEEVESPKKVGYVAIPTVAELSRSLPPPPKVRDGN